MNAPCRMAQKSGSTMISRLLLICAFSLFGTSVLLVASAHAQSDWPMFAGNAAHTGVNDTETGTPPLELNWAAALSNRSLNPVAVAGDQVFVTAASSFDASNPLRALSASDGSELWRHEFGSVFSVNPPSVEDGLVYVQMGNHTPASRIFAFHVEDGTIAWSTPYTAQWESYYAPTLAEGKVFVDGGYYGGMYAFDATMGDTVFFQNALEQYDRWTPTYADGTLYTFIEGKLRAHDPNTGQILRTANVGWRWMGWSMNTVAVLGDGTAYVIAPPILFAVDPVNMTVLWQRDSFFNGTPTYSEGVVYANQSGALQARDAGSGDLLWTFVPPDQLRYPAVIANGFLYISSDTKVHALDLSSHAEVWSSDGGGWLSIANGQLYVAGVDGNLRAFAMTPGSSNRPRSK